MAMLGRLFPNGEQRSIGAVARRMADFEARLGDGLFEQQRGERALAEYRAAQARYAQALAVFARIPDSNTSAERRFAYLGLGKTELRLDRPARAAEAFRRAYALALQERCAAAPEAPSPGWVADLVERLAVASERSGAMAAAADYRHQIVAPPTCAAASPVHASEPSR
jgi:tetratricopeptide (TPR) repeat protein